DGFLIRRRETKLQHDAESLRRILRERREQYLVAAENERDLLQARIEPPPRLQLQLQRRQRRDPVRARRLEIAVRHLTEKGGGIQTVQRGARRVAADRDDDRRLIILEESYAELIERRVACSEIPRRELGLEVGQHGRERMRSGRQQHENARGLGRRRGRGRARRRGHRRRLGRRLGAPGG